ncbi:MAG: hypothetical protein ACMXX5_00940 [Candidatus Woesearchaeota archaeon]
MGISPDKLEFFDNENKLIIFNPNQERLNYTIAGCEHEFVDLLRRGTILPNDIRILTVRYNPSLNQDKITNCSIEVFFANSFYATGFSVMLFFPDRTTQNSNSLLSGFFASDQSESKSLSPDDESNYLLIIAACLIFILAIGLIIKYF